MRADFANRQDASDGIIYSVRTFDQDSSLATGKGWDNVTGVGSPNPGWLSATGRLIDQLGVVVAPRPAEQPPQARPSAAPAGRGRSPHRTGTTPSTRGSRSGTRCSWHRRPAHRPARCSTGHQGQGAVRSRPGRRSPRGRSRRPPRSARRAAEASGAASDELEHGPAGRREGEDSVDEDQRAAEPATQVDPPAPSGTAGPDVREPQEHERHHQHGHQQDAGATARLLPRRPDDAHRHDQHGADQVGDVLPGRRRACPSRTTCTMPRTRCVTSRASTPSSQVEEASARGAVPDDQHEQPHCGQRRTPPSRGSPRRGAPRQHQALTPRAGPRAAPRPRRRCPRRRRWRGTSSRRRRRRTRCRRAPRP